MKTKLDNTYPNKSDIIPISSKKKMKVSLYNKALPNYFYGTQSIRTRASIYKIMKGKRCKVLKSTYAPLEKSLKFKCTRGRFEVMNQKKGEG